MFGFEIERTNTSVYIAHNKIVVVTCHCKCGYDLV